MSTKDLQAAVERQRAFAGRAGKPVWTSAPEEVAKFYGTDLKTGLDPATAAARHKELGFNELFGSSGPSAFKILLGNLFNAMNLVLTIAMIFSFVVADYPVAVSLVIVIIINTAIGFWQEYQGEKTMEALKNMSSPTARVMRDHEIESIPTREVVPGDVVYLEEGDICPADLRVANAVNLEMDEALLTGESLPVSKKDEAISDPEIGVGDRKHMCFMNTVVTKGRGHGVVVATSLCTEIGKIAESLSDDKKDKGPPPGKNKFLWWIEDVLGWHEKTPLQVTMDKLMYVLLVCAILLGLLVFAVNGMTFSSSLLLYAVSVGVAILPEGLPAVVTVTMSVGVARMAKQKAIVRRLNALEALGQVTNICSDKTGTLTEGKMVVTRYWVAGRDYEVAGKGLLPEGEITDKATTAVVSKEEIKKDPAQYKLMLVCKKCVTCDLFFDDEDKAWKSTGDPTEVALEVLARKGLVADDPFLSEMKFVGEHPFDPTIKRMTVMYLHEPTRTVYFLAKGALERVLEVSKGYLAAGGAETPLDASIGPTADAKMLEMAGDAMRVLGFGYRTEVVPADKDISNPEQLNIDMGWSVRENAEQQMIFLGVIGMYDPPRQETRPAVLICRDAGITVHMATGDHPKTAEAIAKQVDIIVPEERSLVLPASTFDKMTIEQVDGLPSLPNVLARCSPQTKVKMVEALHRRDRFVVMTGDGSNDAPAIKMSDVGIAMGLGGSEVTKQVASIVLTDDNFETIVNAVAEGRRIFINISKFVVHLLSGNVAEVIALVCGLAFKDRYGHAIFPMSPIEVLWINMVTSSPIALALGQENADPDIMLRPPRQKSEGLFSKEVIWDTFFYGILMGGMTLGAFIGVMYSEVDPNTTGDCNHGMTEDSCIPIFKARATAYTMLCLLLCLHGYNCRDARRSMFKMRFFENKLLWYIVIAATIGTILTVYIPWVNVNVFLHYLITWQWGIIAAALVIFFIAAELWKLFKRRSSFWNPPSATPTGVHLGEGDEPEHEGADEGFVHYEQRIHHSLKRNATDASIAKLEEATGIAKMDRAGSNISQSIYELQPVPAKQPTNDSLPSTNGTNTNSLQVPGHKV
ncbi:Na+/K+ P-type ATPase [Hyaloraphidium curvatum]|nr:Na+/K+ P-type ATPase [Hyaloraphidium curvatum]